MVGTVDQSIESAVTVRAPVIERLVTIPGVARKTAIGLIAEIGVDMSVFPTPAHLASWEGIRVRKRIIEGAGHGKPGS